MLQITRTAAALTKVTRKALKNVSTGKINLQNASDSFNKFYNNGVKDLKYSNNIFKRTIQWVKDFIKNYKETKSAIKDIITDKTKELGKNLTKKDKKSLKDFFIETVKDGIKAQKTELDKLIKAAKAEKK